MTYGIYARQSVDKKDSISIESQIDFCTYEARGQPCVIYQDKGFSGKNLNRPAFERMCGDIRAGKLTAVIVYKLDRISRSILDFSSLMAFFQQYGVDFISATEKFDTATPMGRAMLNICIVFAQLERETIQQRVADAYATRSRKGLFMGGKPPLGFTLGDTCIDGIRTVQYVPVDAEVKIIRLLFRLYSSPETSLGDILRYLADHNIAHPRGGQWHGSTLSDILKNPCYVKADMAVYNFYKEQGANILSSAHQFTEGNGLYRYRKENAGEDLVIAPHKGIVDACIFLKCRRKALGRRQSTKTCRGKNSWLTGKVKCGKCGYGLMVKKSNTRWGRYFVCSGRQPPAACGGAGTIYAGVLEEYIFKAIGKKLQTLDSNVDYEDNTSDNRNFDVKLAAIQEEIESYIKQVKSADGVLLKYIQTHIEALDQKKETLLADRQAPRYKDSPQRPTDFSTRWKAAGFQTKQAVADILIQAIVIDGGIMEVQWHI